MKKYLKQIKIILLIAFTAITFSITAQGFVPTAHAALVGEGGICGGTSGNTCDPAYWTCYNGKCVDPKTVPVATNTESPLSQQTLVDIANKATVIFRIFHPLIFFFTKHISNFLGTDFVFGGNMGTMLQKIWVISRNIVNIAFVVILLFMAIRYIFGGDDKTDLKKLLPQFAIMLIAVNFTWLASKVIVDAANVTTNIVFAIPSGVQGALKAANIQLDNGTCQIHPDGSKLDNYNCRPTNIYYPVSATKVINMTTDQCQNTGATYNGQNYDTPSTGYQLAYGYIDASGNNPLGPDPKQPYYNTATYCWDNLDISKFDSTNAAYLLTYSMAQVQNLPMASATNLSKLAIGTIFAIIFELVYLVSFAALFVALLFRVAFLWLMVAFSPFIVLMMFMERSTIGKVPEQAKKYISMGAFLKWAFAPAEVAGIWAIGFIMITTGQTATTDLFAKFDAQSSVAAQVYDVNSIFLGMNSLSQIIWFLMTVMLIWTGTMTVLTGLEGAKPVMDWFQKQGNAVGGLIGRAPMWAPIIPSIDAKGQLDFKNRIRLGDMMPATWADKKFSPYSQNAPETENEFNKATEILKKTADKKALSSAQTPADAIAQLQKLAPGLSREKINNASPDRIKMMLEQGGVTKNEQESGRLAALIQKGAKNIPAAPVPAAAEKKLADTIQLTPKDIEQGVLAALKKHDEEMDPKLITPETMSNAGVTPNMNKEDAATKVAEYLRKQNKTSKIKPGGNAEPAKKEDKPKNK